MNSTRDILYSLRHRESRGSFGISTAYPYLKSVEPCFSGGLCPSNVWSVATPARWSKAVKHSKRSLTYADQETCDRDFIVKSINDGTGILPGAVLEYDTVLSSTSRDRDGDIVESKGLELDPRMPLLLHHLPMSPIGKMYKVLSHDDQRVIVKNAIADTELGRDAAVLVKFGSLRTSQGFKPVPGEFVPLGVTKGAGGRDIVTGWHIKRARVYETSLVAIPANEDANILSFDDGMASAYSKGMLHTPFFKSMCKSHFDSRPVSVQAGIDLYAIHKAGAGCSCQKGASMSAATSEAAPVATADQTDPGEGGDAPAEVKGCGGSSMGKCKHCGKKTKDGKCDCSEPGMSKGAEPVETKAASDDAPAGVAPVATTIKALADLATKAVGEDSYYLPGSFEWVSEKLNPTAMKYLAMNADDMDSDGYASVIATYPDSVILCVRKWSGSDYRSHCYRVGWEMDGDMPKLVGKPEAVKVTTQVVTKSLDLSLRTQDGVPAIKALTAAMLRQAALADSDEAVESVASAAKSLAEMADLHRTPNESEQIEALLGIH